ncbi:hypothetical protein [Aridibaculum aurantiacum]|uniref:hypothetical protein n=1 Tax=Aridibaculum aurantiacum TaxID=2810307 RepID=UPI001A95CCC7|nr:hypothetical protein [Aridibaculum aurantiacum]
MSKLRIVVGGYIASYCTSGVTWDYVQYPVGLQLLGHDVYYIEDTLGYHCHFDPKYSWDDPTPVVNYLKETMTFFGMSERWAYRDAVSGKCFGLSEEKLLEVCASADVFINVSCSTFLREEYLKIPTRVLIDSDPMFTQIPNNENPSQVEAIQASFKNYTHLFSFGENIMAEDSKVPTYSFKWYSTRQPVCLDYWANQHVVNKKTFTTIMNLSARKKIQYDNEEWGQKDLELEKVVQIPELCQTGFFEMILSCSVNNRNDGEHTWLRQNGWKILKAVETIGQIHDYSAFIKNSYAEFSVAKHTYVKANTGWFSCRSACYLAAGKPVIVQDTKWSKYIPAGEGALAFDSISTAKTAVDDVLCNYEKHKKRAKEIAYEYFDSQKVLNRMLEDLN